MPLPRTVVDGELPLVIRGDTWRQPISVQDDTGAPVDVTGATFVLRVREIPESEDDTAPTVLEQELTISDATGGDIFWLFTSTETRTLVDDAYLVELEITDSLGDVQTAWQLPVSVRDDFPDAA